MTYDNEAFYTARGYETSSAKHNLTPSMEDYLEMIYRLSKRKGYTRVNDLANKLNVQPPSVTKMMKKLNEKNLLFYKKYDIIRLTSKGKKQGHYLVQRHNTIKEFLKILATTDNLNKDVETLEHHISQSTLHAIACLTKFMSNNENFLKEFHNYKKNLSTSLKEFEESD